MKAILKKTQVLAWVLVGMGTWDTWGQEGYIASPIQQTWTWANSGRQRGTGRPSVLQSTGSQKVGHDLATEQQQLAWVLRSWKCMPAEPLWIIVWRVLKNWKIQLPYDPATQLLGINPKEWKSGSQRDIFTLMFTVTFTWAKTWDKPDIHQQIYR